ncbi:alpha/beta hydrolase [Edaphobacter bradus]|uniref:alpha/beta hydrolase n=1 Tax=Edaphobacter bradus TaxID=2259016 RepID=UPI0021DFA1EE|nr:alpha/beta fold hydrolase [Edaphobacter bradus]
MPRPTSKLPAALSQTEAVNPLWLLRALGLVLVAALLCSYLALCLLFLQGQWQIVLHPIHSDAKPPATPEAVHFGPDESAIPQLLGVWMPVASGARYATTTILFLPGGDGSRSDFTPTLEALHQLGLNVFAFDYRGYGFSAKTHPSQKKMSEDAESAWRYLTLSRAIPAGQIVPYGAGVGASLAAQLTLAHPEVPALILDSPCADLLKVARYDPRSVFIPVRLLFHERFPLAEPLSTLRAPKLLITTGKSSAEAFRTASDPKISVELPAANGALYGQAITRFLDQYLPQAPDQIVPSAAPLPTNSR